MDAEYETRKIRRSRSRSRSPGRGRNPLDYEKVMIGPYRDETGAELVKNHPQLAKLILQLGEDVGDGVFEKIAENDVKITDIIKRSATLIGYGKYQDMPFCTAIIEQPGYCFWVHNELNNSNKFDDLKAWMQDVSDCPEALVRLLSTTSDKTYNIARFLKLREYIVEKHNPYSEGKTYANNPTTFENLYEEDPGYCDFAVKTVAADKKLACTLPLMALSCWLNENHPNFTVFLKKPKAPKTAKEVMCEETVNAWVRELVA